MFVVIGETLKSSLMTSHTGHREPDDDLYKDTPSVFVTRDTFARFPNSGDRHSSLVPQEHSG